MAIRRTGGRIYRRNGSWCIDYLDTAGKRVRRSVGQSRAEAEEQLARALERRAAIIGVPIDAGPEPLLGSLWLHAIARCRVESRPATVLGYEAARRKFRGLDRRKVHALRQRDIDWATDALYRKYSVSTVNTYLRRFRATLNKAVRDGLVKKESIHFTIRTRRELKQLPKTLSVGCFHQLLEIAPGPSCRIALLIGWYCGLRIGETHYLRWQDIDFETRELRVVAKPPLFVPKTLEERTVPIASKLAYELEPFARDAGWVMPGLKGCGRPVHRQTIDRWFRAMSKQTGMPITSHMLRRTWATRLLASGVGVGVVMRLGGWSNLATLNNYIGLDRDAAVAAVDML